MDLNHIYGSDLSVSPTGDIALATIEQTGVQRCYRRLLTNPALRDVTGDVVASGDMLAHQEYGAGVGRLVGSPQDVSSTQSLIQGQMLIEQAVSQATPPKVNVTPVFDGLSTSIQYVDANTSSVQFLSFDISK